MRNVSPELFSLAGDTSARGVYLDDYGVYFDVGVPILRPSMVWSFRQIYERDNRQTLELINELKRMSSAARGQADRRAFDAVIAKLEATIDPTAAPGVTAAVAQDPNAVGAAVGGAVVTPERPAAAAQVAPPAATNTTPGPRATANQMLLKDPNRAYTEAVQRALIDAMIDYSGPMLIAPHEWLTVAARDNAPRDMFAPQDPFDEVVTILLRIKGEDLGAYRAGKIDREEAKKRVQVREF
jgi:hypothetical protein